jgi:MoxR-like ATPase
VATATKRKRKKKVEEEEVLDLDQMIDFDEDEQEEEEEKPRKRSTKKRSAKDPSRMAKDTIKKLAQIKGEISDRIFEREEVIDDLMRALIAGENVLLLGPPGTGKTLLADLFGRHIEQAEVFKWLMNRTTDPADIVGPYSVKQMENDRFLRITKGRAPQAHVAFFDEIFKANEPALNFMLSMLNEGIFYNDGKAEDVELRIAIGASNEYPETDDLEAFYDRFIFRHWVNYLQDPQNRIEMGKAARTAKQGQKSIAPPTMVSLEEIDNLQSFVHTVTFPDQLAKVYDRMYRALQNQTINISDRRYYKGQVVMMANALLNGRTTVTSDDFRSLKYVLWNKDVKEIDVVEQELSKFVNPYESKVKELLKKATEVKDNTLKIDNRTERAGEAVQANSTLQDIIGKMEDELDEASNNGVDTTALEKMVREVEDMMDTINTECLKQSNRGSRHKW